MNKTSLSTPPPPHPVLLAGCNRSDVKQGKEMRCNTRQVKTFKRVHTLLDKASHNTIKRETTTATSVFFLMKSEGTQ